jgi:hypothetical protein
LIERKTIERLTPALDQAAIEVRHQPQNIAEQIPRDGDLGHLEAGSSAIPQTGTTGRSCVACQR